MNRSTFHARSGTCLPRTVTSIRDVDAAHRVARRLRVLVLDAAAGADDLPRVALVPEQADAGHRQRAGRRPTSCGRRRGFRGRRRRSGTRDRARTPCRSTRRGGTTDIGRNVPCAGSAPQETETQTRASVAKCNAAAIPPGRDRSRAHRAGGRTIAARARDRRLPRRSSGIARRCEYRMRDGRQAPSPARQASGAVSVSGGPGACSSTRSMAPQPLGARAIASPCRRRRRRRCASSSCRRRSSSPSKATAERYAARAPGVSRAQVAELRGGKVHAEATLDLHGETVESRQAPACASSSSTPPGSAGAASWSSTARARTPSTARRCARPCSPSCSARCSGLVHALATAAPADGGEGATYVMLRGSP